MTDYQISVVVDSDTEGLASGADQASGAITELGKTAEAAGGDVDAGMQTAKSGVEGLAETTGSASGSIASDLSTASESVTGLGDAATDTAGTIDSATSDAAGSIASVASATDDAADAVASGTDAMSSSFDDLSTAAGDAATEISTSLTTDVPAAVDASGVSISTKAGKFKAVGTTLGTQLSSGIASGAGGAQAVATTTQSLTGLLAFAAKSPVAIAAVLGLGIGTSLVTNLIKGIQERENAITDTVNGILGSMELSTRSTMRDIRETILDGLDFQNQAEALGGGDLEQGLSKIQQLADDFGVSLRTAGDLIRGKVTPATTDLKDRLQESAAQGVALSGSMGRVQTSSNETSNFAQDILNHVTDTREEVQRSHDGLETALGYYKDSAFWSAKVAADAATTAYQLGQAAQSAQAIGAGLRDAAGIVLGDTQ